MREERLLVATRSAGKLMELVPMLASTGMKLLTLSDAGIPPHPDEDELEVHDTFEANALAKARYFHGKSGLRVVADDSGLEVFGLGGRPGVHSKRWSGRSDLDGEELDEANRQMLLRELGEGMDRTARFVCAAAHVDGGREDVVRGETYGVILHAPRGDGGFGYDPLFLSDDLGRTLAECTREEKERVSHRGRAFQKLARDLATARAR